MAPGVGVEAVRAATGAELRVPDQLTQMRIEGTNETKECFHDE